ncbi:hypothetical protein AA0522_1728 [Gluconacetobacter liquefaciens NRIC 0522]|nr:hypothetical protein AA0522_1728 [Gluconacetobacter liquefaciens NRIC 0522]
MTTASHICIAGVGAIGGTLAACLARGGASVSLIARGETLSRLRTHGLTVTEGETTFTCHPAAAERAPGPMDVLFLAVKSHQLPSLLPAVLPAVGPDTLIVPVINGIPWWMAADDAPPAFRTLAPPCWTRRANWRPTCRHGRSRAASPMPSAPAKPPDRSGPCGRCAWCWDVPHPTRPARPATD